MASRCGGSNTCLGNGKRFMSKRMKTVKKSVFQGIQWCHDYRGSSEDEYEYFLKISFIKIKL